MRAFTIVLPFRAFLYVSTLVSCSLAAGCGDGGGLGGEVIRGRFESAGPIRGCDQVVSWSAPDGVLLRPSFSTCGDDMAALAHTIVANLDAVEVRGARALLVIGQGVNLPASWLAECETYTLEDPTFSGQICVPWDPRYQERLRAALVDVIGPAVRGHPALAGVYFTITTMTNGSELHFRVARSSFTPDPGDEVFRGAYLDVMDLFQEAFETPILFEAGHCIFHDPPGGAVEPVDCDTPLALYRHARDTYGTEKVGIALWNCAERFWATETPEGLGVRSLIEEASRDEVSIGCQTVGSFTDGACRFTNAAVGDYGEPGDPGSRDMCPASASFDPEGACVDTMEWFTGTSRQSPTSVQVRGTWAENWSREFDSDGVYETSPACRAAIDRLAR